MLLLVSLLTVSALADSSYTYALRDAFDWLTGEVVKQPFVHFENETTLHGYSFVGTWKVISPRSEVAIKDLLTLTNEDDSTLCPTNAFSKQIHFHTISMKRWYFADESWLNDPHKIPSPSEMDCEYDERIQDVSLLFWNKTRREIGLCPFDMKHHNARYFKSWVIDWTSSGAQITALAHNYVMVAFMTLSTIKLLILRFSPKMDDALTFPVQILFGLLYGAGSILIYRLYNERFTTTWFYDTGIGFRKLGIFLINISMYAAQMPLTLTIFFNWEQLPRWFPKFCGLITMNALLISSVHLAPELLSTRWYSTLFTVFVAPVFVTGDLFFMGYRMYSLPAANGKDVVDWLIYITWSVGVSILAMVQWFYTEWFGRYLVPWECICIMVACKWFSCLLHPAYEHLTWQELLTFKFYAKTCERNHYSEHEA